MKIGNDTQVVLLNTLDKALIPTKGGSDAQGSEKSHRHGG